MLRIEPRTLESGAQQRLDDLHKKVDEAVGFEAKRDKATSLWDTKNASIVGRSAFDQIKNTLAEMSIGHGICNYCEQSRAGDIEHIWPKSFFPLRAFKWENYLYACKQCNTGNKLAQAWIFPDAHDSPVALKTGEAPASEALCFIDPRAEDPTDFIELELDGANPLFMHFLPRTVCSPGSRDYHKAEKTLEILRLNEDETLVAYRREAFGHYKRLLKEYVLAKQALDHQALEDAIVGDPPVDFSKPLEDERERILSKTRDAVVAGLFPSVWQAMRTNTHLLSPAIQDLFDKAGVAGWPSGSTIQ